MEGPSGLETAVETMVVAKVVMLGGAVAEGTLARAVVTAGVMAVGAAAVVAVASGAAMVAEVTEESGATTVDVSRTLAMLAIHIPDTRSMILSFLKRRSTPAVR